MDSNLDNHTNARADVVPNALPGCRMHRLEVFNWGTFDRKVWTFEIDGRNALLTGDIGSGKSTLVDAVTTLLLPANRISYNKAAGADTRERDLRSYVLGHYKSERNETTGTSRPVGLRDARHYSVVLGVFANTGFGTTVTLAQVFRTREQDQGQPDRFFVVADTELSIAKHFSDFGADFTGLRRKLRELGARVHDTFPDYGKDFRRHLGIESEQAMDLFHQTVSMKAVDNLNDFVRSHMLEPFDARDRIEALVDHFANLTNAHEAVLRARAQLELLSPLVDDLDAYEAQARVIGELGDRQAALPFFFADCTRDLLGVELARLTTFVTQLDAEIHANEANVARLREEDEQLGIQIAGQGGDRLSAIDDSITRCDEDLPIRRTRFDRFNELLTRVGLVEVSVAAQFRATWERVEARDAELRARDTDIENSLVEHRHEKRQLDDEAHSVNGELQSLRTRQSNLPRRSLELREQMCGELGIEASDVPFAGELIRVRDDATEWEGAAERVLRNFALSVLVPNAHYDRVATWINDRHLNARLVYFRVPEHQVAPPTPERRGAHPLLCDLLEIKPHTAFEPWLGGELRRRTNHACVNSMAEFRAADQAVTRQGQVKHRNRHEKDDRRQIGDRRDYVLGWTTEQKINALIQYAQTLHSRQQEFHAAIEAMTAERTAVTSQLTTLAALREYSNWDDLDWSSLVQRITDWRAEAHRIRSSSDELMSLTTERERVRAEIDLLTRQLNQFQRDRGGAEAEQSNAERDLARVNRLLADNEALAGARLAFPHLEEFIAAGPGLSVMELTTIHDAEQAVAVTLAARRDDAVSKQALASQRVVRAMGRFRSAYPQETAELDDSIASAGEYRELHHRIATDDLPRFEHEFKRYLNENTIREIASLSAALGKQETTIRDRVKRINESLHGIDYNDGRYIRLVADQTPNTEIRAFREELRTCTSNVVGTNDSDQYSETRFLQVKSIIDRFKGREGTVDQDRNWTRRVTDVRQWFVFSASERWRNDDAEYENYTDSAGKSGGQKEKLAYTILAASLAYQFKLDWDATSSKAFRFVVIDEAFGRGSDDSTRYALGLFTRLGLQLLIVTPLQKIQVIEPHVSSVGFVDNLNGNYSRLQCLTVEEHQRRRRERDATRSAST